MMRLMIEDVSYEQFFGFGQLAAGGGRIPSEITVERGRLDGIRPVHDDTIEPPAFGGERIPIAELHQALSNGLRGWPRRCSQTRQPHLIRPQEMIKRRVNRAEESASVLLARGVAEERRSIIDVAVLPSVVARHSLYIGRRNHAPLRPGAKAR